MTDQGAAAQVLERSIRKLNQDRADQAPLRLEDDTPLLGERSPLDSLGLVSLIAILETEIRDSLGRTVALVDESGLDSEISPFRTIATLRRHLSHLLEQPGSDG